MFDFAWHEPSERQWLDRHRLREPEYCLARGDGVPLAGGRRGRATFRLPSAADDPGGWSLCLKREPAIAWLDLAGSLLRSEAPRSRIRRELDNLRALTAAGLPTVRPLACFERRLPRWAAYLVYAEPSAAVPLGAHLAASRTTGDSAADEDLFAGLGQLVARLHGAGFFHPELYASNLLVARDALGWRYWLRNVQRVGRAGRLAIRARAADWAALMATLPTRLASSRLRRLAIDAYLTECQLEEQALAFVEAAAARTERLLRYRKIWELRESDTLEHRSVRQLEVLEAGRMWIDRQYRPLLERAGLADFDAMMATTRGHKLRALRDRENWRLELDDGHLGTRGAYLKKHHFATLGTWMRAKLGTGPGETPGRAEARSVARLGRGGIAAMRLIAFGEKLHRDGRLESFVLTEELAGFAQLDHFLKRRFSPRPVAEPRRRMPDLDQLIRDVADVAARFHRMGYNHRDLYCCHFFIQEPAAGQFRVHLIDLQRVEHRRRLRRRWIVKDLAQLAYSAPADRISCTQRLAFMHRYLGVTRLRPQDKRLVRQVLAKQRRMVRSLGPHP